MADITKGYTFASGEQCTAAKLNNLIDLATIDADFISGKSGPIAPALTDEFLFVDATDSALKNCQFTNIIKSTLLISSQDSATPAEGDSIIFGDADDSNNLKKSTLTNVFNNALPTNFISAKTPLTTPLGADELLVWDTTATAFKKITRSNLFYQWWSELNLDDGSITALSGAGAVQETDTLIVADADAADATKKLTIGGLLKFLTAGSNAIVDADQMLLYDSVAAGGRSITADKVKTYAQTGCIMQVVQTAKTDIFGSTADSNWTDITGLSVNITPRDANSKVLVSAMVSGWTRNGAVAFRILRGATPIGVGDLVGSEEQGMASIEVRDQATAGACVTMEYLDSPASASQVTYKVQFYKDSGNDFVLNADQHDARTVALAANDVALSSTITAKEIAA